MEIEYFSAKNISREDLLRFLKDGWQFKQETVINYEESKIGAVVYDTITRFTRRKP